MPLILVITASAGTPSPPPVTPVQLNTPGSFAAGTPLANSIPLSWTDTNSSPNEVNFELRKNTVNNLGTSTVHSNPAQNATSANVTGLNPETTYYFWIIAKGNGTTTLNSTAATVSATTAATTTTLSAPVLMIQRPTTNKDTALKLEWAAVTGAGNYILEFSPSGVGTDRATGVWTEIANTALLTFTHTGRTPMTKYHYRIKAQADGQADSSWGENHCITYTSGTVYELNPGGDGGSINTGGVPAGSTVVIKDSAPWSYCYFANFNGASGNRTLIVTEGDLDMSAGITLENCNHLIVSGSGANRSRPYGAFIGGTGNTSPGLEIKGLCTNIKMEYLKVYDIAYLIWVKNEPISYQNTADNGAQFWYPVKFDNIELSNLLGENCHQDTFYINSSRPYNGRTIFINNGTGTHTIASVGATMTVTIPAGKTSTINNSYYVSNINWYKLKIDDNNYVIGTLNNYNNTTGVLTINVTSKVGSGTASSWALEMDPRPTGGKNFNIHHCTIDRAGRQGIQWGGVDEGTNLIHDNYIYGTGYEEVPEQGVGIFLGSASGPVEVYNNTIENTYRQSIASYHFGMAHIHDNITLNAGRILRKHNLVKPFKTILQVNATKGNNMSALVRVYENQLNDGTPNWVVPVGSSWKFRYYSNTATDVRFEVIPVGWVSGQTTYPTQTPQQALALYAQTAIGGGTGKENNPWLGFGSTTPILESDSVWEDTIRLPYPQPSITINPFDAINTTLYGTPAGLTSWRVERNTFGTNVIPANTTVTDVALEILATNDNYGTGNTFCSNTVEGAAQSSGNISKDPAATVTWSTTSCP